MERAVMASRASASAYQPALVHVGWQPILTATGALYGYELLFRGTAQATASSLGDVQQA
jgi:c-di-GMP-related signal transduction protein